MNMKFYNFERTKGSNQKRPPLKKYVLVRCKSNVEGFPDPIVVGYRKDGAGDKQSPYFVVPGANAGEPYQWCDCLPGNFQWPKGEGKEK